MERILIGRKFHQLYLQLSLPSLPLTFQNALSGVSTHGGPNRLSRLLGGLAMIVISAFDNKKKIHPTRIQEQTKSFLTCGSYKVVVFFICVQRCSGRLRTLNPKLNVVHLERIICTRGSKLTSASRVTFSACLASMPLLLSFDNLENPIKTISPP